MCSLNGLFFSDSVYSLNGLFFSDVVSWFRAVDIELS